MPAVVHELAHAKLTRSLKVTGRRPDGYHLLEAEMLTVALTDVLTFEEGEGLSVDDAVAWCGDASAAGPGLGVPTGGDNLVLRALRLVGRRARVRLEKAIPPGAGLGGGSADAAAVLRWAGVDDPVLAATLGADVPFCVRGGRSMVRGIGEVLEPLAVEEATFVLLTPDFPVSTPAVYAAYDELGAGGGDNDLEAAAIAIERRLLWVRELFTSVAGSRPTLAGSGSTYFLECAADEADALRHDLCGALGAAGRRGVVAVAAAVGPAQLPGPPTP